MSGGDGNSKYGSATRRPSVSRPSRGTLPAQGELAYRPSDSFRGRGYDDSNRNQYAEVTSAPSPGGGSAEYFDRSSSQFPRKSASELVSDTNRLVELGGAYNPMDRSYQTATPIKAAREDLQSKQRYKEDSSYRDRQERAYAPEQPKQGRPGLTKARPDVPSQQRENELGSQRKVSTDSSSYRKSQKSQQSPEYEDLQVPQDSRKHIPKHRRGSEVAETSRYLHATKAFSQIGESQYETKASLGTARTGFEKQPSSFFWPGRMIMFRHAEPYGQKSNEHGSNKGSSSGRDKEISLESIPGIIMQGFHGHCLCAKVHTHGGRGAGKFKDKPALLQNVAYLYTEGSGLSDDDASRPDSALMRRPLYLQMSPGKSLKENSIIHFDKLVTIEYNTPVSDLGAVMLEYRDQMKLSWYEAILGISPTHTQPI